MISAKICLFSPILESHHLKLSPTRGHPLHSQISCTGWKDGTDALLLLALLEKQLELLTGDLSDGTNLPTSRIPTSATEPAGTRAASIRPLGNSHSNSRRHQTKDGEAQDHLNPALASPEVSPVHPARSTWAITWWLFRLYCLFVPWMKSFVPSEMKS